MTLGRSAGPGQYPWVTALLYTRGGVSLPLCGAALVSRSHLLTAGHCTETLGGFTLSRARLGQVDVSGPVQRPGLEVGILWVARHPRYLRQPLAQADIAVVKLVAPVRFSDHVRPICLVAGEEGEQEKLEVAGWGRTEHGPSSSSLQHISLQLVSGRQCQEEYRRAVEEGRLGAAARGLQILASMVCARGREGADSCSGDSGAPLMARGGQGSWVLRGLVSFGTQECDSSLPGVYTR